MISINDHLSTQYADVTKFLAEIVEEMWADLNPVNRFEKPIKHALTSKAGRLRALVSKQEHVDLVGADAQARQLKYVALLEDSTYLKHIITAKPDQFKSIISTAQGILRDEDLFVIEKGIAKSQPFGALLLSKVFNYTSYRSSDHCYKRYQKLLFEQATCPYCNDESAKIIKITKSAPKSKVMMLYDIDHFYPKHAFPYLALSFYNHVPSCKTCNQTFKEGKIFDIDTHIHPYQQCFDSTYRFELNHSVLANEPVEKVKLVNVGTFPDELAGALRLEERYTFGTKLARTATLIDILSKRTHLLANPACAPDEFNALLDLINAFGVVKNKKEILTLQYGKYNRDIVKMFDVNNVLDIN
ncbi:hypothetical protein [Pseudomonas putida]|uniref:hypothetical protein n=1 Tax=Pseudomonas putida TaxID=303 RepID=UPI0018DA1317|nr:hypothetical protein [Pseudomonas putida]MBH3470588.1 hypothetical protein [Pseudomonas putida]